MELKRANNGVWYIHYTEHGQDPSGRKVGRSRRVSTRTTDRAEAEKVMAGAILENGSSRDGDMAVCAALDDYWSQHASRVESEERIHVCIRHLKGYFGVTLVSAIDRTLMDGYYAERRAEGIQDGTLRSEASTLIAAINHCAREKRLDKNLVPYIVLPQEPAAKDRWLTHGEADALRGACRDDLALRVFVELGLGTASRKRALETLTWFQVDLERRLIDLNPAGRRQTTKRRPRVPISDELLPWLRRAKEELGSEWVLGGQYRVADRFETIVKRAGLWSAVPQRNVTPHTMRHSWATWAAQSGVSLWDIAGVLGDTLATVERKYAHHSPDYLRDAVNFKRKELGDGPLSRDG